MGTVGEKLRPGSDFAGFTILRPLGEGGFGAVYEAIHRGSGETVALKILRSEVASNEEVNKRFLREAQAVAQLHHPHIVAPIDMGEHEGLPYLAMELLRGEPLSAMMNREGALPLARALDVLLPVMSAIRTVHDHGIVHRDLKPDNLFITYGSGYAVHPKLLDFGFAKFDDRSTRITRGDTTIGTPNFMAPEQLHSPHAVDTRADVWALGVLLYYVLTNVKPFGASTLVGTLKAVLHSDPQPLRALRPDLPPEVEAVVTRALCKHPDGRYATVHAMASALMPWASDEAAMVYAAEFSAEAAWPADEPTHDRLGPALAEASVALTFEADLSQHAPAPEALAAPVAAPYEGFVPRASQPTPHPHSLQPVVAPARAPSSPPPQPAPQGLSTRAWLLIVGAAAVLGAVLAGTWMRVVQPPAPHAASPVMMVTPDAGARDAARE